MTFKKVLVVAMLGHGAFVGCGSSSPGSKSPEHSQASCVPTDCSQVQPECGVVDDGCGGTLDCGQCPPQDEGAVTGPSEEVTVLSTSGDCADVAVPHLPDAVHQEIALPDEAYCDHATSDGSGAVAISARAARSAQSQLHFFTVGGEPLLMYTGARHQVVPQPLGFHGAFVDVPNGPAEFRALDAVGKVITSTPVSGFADGDDRPTIAADPNGGSVVANHSAKPVVTEMSSYDENRYLVRRFAADGAPASPEVEVLSMTSGASGPRHMRVLGVAPQGHSLVVTSFREAATGYWLSSTSEKVGESALHHTWPGAFLYDGSYVAWSTERDLPPKVIAPPNSSSAPSSNGTAPAWLNEVRNQKITFLPGRNGYAVTMNGPGCGNTIQLRSKSGALCSVVTLRREEPCFAHWVGTGWDGTVIQGNYPDPNGCGAGGCKCNVRWWPRLLQ